MQKPYQELLALTEYERWVHEIWADTEGQSETEQMRALFIACVGASGELGELLEPIKKAIRKRVPVNELPRIVDQEALKNEVGDVLYYLARISKHLGFTLQESMEANVRKLVHRYGAHKPVRVIGGPIYKCPDAQLPDGPVGPRCGGRRGPSGVDGGSWVHY